jgi:DNA topoisomerase-3
VGRTAKPVTGFRGRSGRTFRAKLRLEQDEEGKWRVDFDEDWAKEPPKDAETETEADTGAQAAASAGGDGADSNGTPARERETATQN